MAKRTTKLFCGYRQTIAQYNKSAWADKSVEEIAVLKSGKPEEIVGLNKQQWNNLCKAFNRKDKKK